MWFFAPYSLGAASAAAMMMLNPFYWGLYMSMAPAPPSTGK
jgi:hypothetical protein